MLSNIFGNIKFPFFFEFAHITKQWVSLYLCGQNLRNGAIANLFEYVPGLAS